MAEVEEEALAPQEEKPVADEESSQPQRLAQDPLNTEFQYYSAALRVLAPTLTQDVDRKVIIPWARKLFRPEYHSSKLKEKRNRYLVYLCCSLLLDQSFGPFQTLPPDGALINCNELQAPGIIQAEWEIDNMWQDTLSGLPDDFQMLECCIHATSQECRDDHTLDKILDQEFQFYLYIAKPYAYLIRNGNDRTRVAAWLQMLCSIHGPECCSSMKAIRNDYMMAFLGYLQDLRAVGPFVDLPSWKTLPPLAEAAKAAAENKPITDPTGADANDFLMNQPVPEDGAFCYIALTGDLGLDMSRYTANHMKPSKYNLYAISNHSGTTYNGHYTAYCQHPYTGHWHEYNDSKVSSISPKSLVSEDAYILFYESEKDATTSDTDNGESNDIEPEPEQKPEYFNHETNTHNKETILNL